MNIREMSWQEVVTSKRLWSVQEGDCLELMREMPNASVDFVFGSPPYEKARTYGPHVNFKLKGQVWVDWMFEVVIESLRISRGLVAFVVEGQTKNFSYSGIPLLLAADLLRAGVTLRKPGCYHRVGIPGSGGPDFLRNDWEFIIYATSGGKLPWSDNTATGHPPKWAPGGEMSYRLSDGTRRNEWRASEKSGGGRKLNGDKDVRDNGELEEIGNFGHSKDGSVKGSHAREIPREKKLQSQRKADGERKMDGLYTAPVLANPGNVFHCTVGKGNMGDALCHKNHAPFPEKLAESHILTFCPEDGIALDPFSGSGTTGKMALRHHRRYIGFDVNPEDVENSQVRIEKAVSMFHGVPEGTVNV
jgi:hypothetical protein